MDGPSFSAGRGGWDYRVVAVERDGQLTYGIYEVYYDEDGSPAMRTEAASEPYGTSLEELRTDYDNMAEAFLQPLLTERDGRMRPPLAAT